MSDLLPSLILEKLREQVERTLHLLDMVPADKLDWRPELKARGPARPLRLGELLGHLLECLAGFCATLYAMHSDRLAHFTSLRELPVNHRCSAEEARERINQYMAHIEEGFGLVSDQDLTRRIPTVFVPDGEAALTIILGNLEHLINHKYQLFFYLKMLGVALTTADLYRTRGSSGR